MPTIRFLLQGLSHENDHYAALNELFTLRDINCCIISSAYINEAGVDMFVEKLSEISNCCKVYVGIRNGASSKQALEKLLSAGINPYCVDTATQAYIFHPKVYFASNNSHAKTIIGSANFTSRGLTRNLEAGALIDLDLAAPDDAAFATNIKESFATLEALYPQNVFVINDQTDLNEMVDQGLLIDEANITSRATSAATTRGRTEHRPRMLLNTRYINAGHRPRHAVITNNFPTHPITTGVINNALLWRSAGLTERDLNIPTGTNTHATGDMNLKLGDPSQNIDFQVYFRREVFSNAEWVADSNPRTAHIERAHVRFRIIIKNVDYGEHELIIKFNTRTDTISYQQHNCTTSIQWGTTVKSMIAHRDLLDGTMSIYAPPQGSEVYTLVFDNN